ncbi:MAG: ABC transporter permease, partial [Spirochaetales bacterium]|nr:ABC transporter permease [Spirochaetales bacterium]
MKLPLAVYLGLRNLLGKHGRVSPNLLGSVLGIGLSLIPLLVVLEVADGMIEGITRRYVEVGTYHAQVLVPGSESPGEFAGLAETLRRVPGVTQVIPERQGIGLLYTPEERTAVTIRAVPPGLYRGDEGFR